MTEGLALRAGRAVRWRTVQLIGVNAIFFLRIVVLARLLAPEAFGLLAVALVPIGLFLRASDLGMIPALVQAESPSRRHYDVAWTIGLARGLITSALVLAAAPWIADFAGEPRAADLTRALALQPLLASAASIRLADLQRRLDFRALALISLSEAIFNTLVAIALAPFVGVWALVAGTLAGALAQVVASYLAAPGWPRLALQASAARSLIRFGQWIFVSGLLATLGGAALRLLISRRLGAAELGVYFLATKFTFMIADAVAGVAESVSFPVYASLQKRTQEVAAVFRRVVATLAALVVPFFAVGIAVAPSLVTEILGPAWQGSAPVLQALGLVCILGVLGDVTVPTLKGLGRPSRVALLEGVQGATLLALAWVLSARYGVWGVAIAWLPAVAIAQLLSAIFVARAVPDAFAGLAPALLAVGLSSALGAGVAWWIDQALPGLPGLFAGAALGGGCALGLLWLADRRWDVGLVSSVAEVFPRSSLARWVRDADASDSGGR